MASIISTQCGSMNTPSMPISSTVVLSTHDSPRPRSSANITTSAPTPRRLILMAASLLPILFGMVSIIANKSLLKLAPTPWHLLVPLARQPLVMVSMILHRPYPPLSSLLLLHYLLVFSASSLSCLPSFSNCSCEDRQIYYALYIYK